MPAGPLISRYSGVCWYRRKACSQSAWLSGGIAPLTGFHSVIDRPLSVSLVIPPTTTIRKTSAATANSQFETASGRACRAGSAAIPGVSIEFRKTSVIPAMIRDLPAFKAGRRKADAGSSPA